MPKEAKETKEPRPRWYNQSYIVFLALRQAGKPLHRPDLIKATLALDKKLSKERSLPLLFRGKTPQNTASGILTTNANGYFKSCKPPGEKSTIFSLAFQPADLDSAIEAYNEWERELVDIDWPIFFSPITGDKWATCADRYNSIMRRRIKNVLDQRPVLVRKPTESPVDHDKNTRSKSNGGRRVVYTNDFSLDDYYDGDISHLGFVDESATAVVNENITSAMNQPDQNVNESAGYQQNCTNQISDRSSDRLAVEQSMLPKLEASVEKEMLAPPSVDKPNLDQPITEQPLEDLPSLDQSALDQTDQPSLELDDPLIEQTVQIPSSIKDLLRIAPSTLPNAGTGCFSNYKILPHTLIGFYFGVPMTEDEFDSLKDSTGLASSFSV